MKFIVDFFKMSSFRKVYSCDEYDLNFSNPIFYAKVCKSQDARRDLTQFQGEFVLKNCSSGGLILL
jgi:hypothetical protein